MTDYNYDAHEFDLAGSNLSEDDADILDREYLEEDEEYEREIEEGNRSFIHLKWIADECKTLSEVGNTLRLYAEELDELKDEGFELEEPVDNGHGSIVRKKDK